jgi:cell division protein FtsB
VANPWIILYRAAWVLLLALVITGLVCVFMPKWNGLGELQRKKASIQEENRQIELLTQELRHKRERLKSDAEFAERTAREAGMVRSNEIIFKFTDQVATTPEAE